MNDNIANLVLENLRKIQAEQAASRERDAEIFARLAHLESGIARIARDESANFSEIVSVRHAVDRLGERVERVERRLELIP